MVTDIASAKAVTDKLANEVGQIILGKEQEIQLALACILAGGHLLIEDVPGVGKTLMARSLARSLGLSFSRIQFTSDLMPADVIGVSIYQQNDNRFVFHKGPLFAQMVLADEVNRAAPKSQSALLEAMEEQQVTVDGESWELPQPFVVIATQNPAHQIGTYPLPESQLDRFLMQIGLGYPSEPLERKLLRGDDRRGMLKTLRPQISGDELPALQHAIKLVEVSEALLDYVQALTRYTREHPDFELGLSPRASIDLINAARAWALIQGHAGVQPEDLQSVFAAVADHRLRLNSASGAMPGQAAMQVLAEVAIP
ncbi:MAG: MoxR family ATPase [Chromatiales bacterium]|jgi:MoxR-like ATPase|nr:MoxR family ATPase [Chromatiales bacterium]